jgi:fructose 1,6-bisphosphatase
MHRRNFEKTEPLFLHYCDRTNRGAYAKRVFRAFARGIPFAFSIFKAD